MLDRSVHTFVKEELKEMGSPKLKNCEKEKRFPQAGGGLLLETSGSEGTGHFVQNV